MMIPLPLLVVFQGAFNRALALDPDAIAALQPLEGRIVEVQISNMDVSVFAIIVSDGIELSRFHDGEPDTTLTGSVFDLLSLLKDPQALMSGSVSLSGDVATARQLKKIATDLDIDWEEHFSGLIGDAPAHQLFRFGNSVQSFFTRGAERFEQRAGDFIKNGSSGGTSNTEHPQGSPGGIAVSNTDVDSYCQSVDDLRSDMDRLEARLAKLEKPAINTINKTNTTGQAGKTGD